MVFLRAITTVILAGLAGLVSAQSSTGNSVLVVLDKDLKKASFSTFFGGLESTFRSILEGMGRTDEIRRTRVSTHVPRTHGCGASPGRV
jgi:hypothetical protein